MRLAAIGRKQYEGTTRKSGDHYVWTGRINVHQAAFDEPLRWRKPQRVFVNSMSDVFHEDMPPGVIGRMWAVMGLAHWHQFLILTKRPDRTAAIVPELPLLPNVWLGTSVENSDYDFRIAVPRRRRATNSARSRLL